LHQVNGIGNRRLVPRRIRWWTCRSSGQLNSPDQDALHQVNGIGNRRLVPRRIRWWTCRSSGQLNHQGEVFVVDCTELSRRGSKMMRGLRKVRGLQHTERRSRRLPVACPVSTLVPGGVANWEPTRPLQIDDD
jgi:hypothetical protein